MGRIKRPTKRVVNTGQRSLGFAAPAAKPDSKPALADELFKEDDSSSIFFGEQRLDQYLNGAGMGWVIGLRKIMERLDYSLLTQSYSQRGRQAFHPRTVLGLMVYGLFARCLALRDLERLSKSDLGAMWMCGGHRIDHSTIGNFVLRHEETLGKDFFASVTAWVVHELKLSAGVSSIDGTVIESAASHWAAIRAEAAKLKAVETRQAAAADPQNEDLEAAAVAAEKVAAVAEQRREKRSAQGKQTQSVAVVPSDPDAVIQPRKDGAQRPSYKPCTLMHEAGVIIGQQVHPSSESATVNHLLEQHHQIFGVKPRTLLLDAGFNTGPMLAQLVERDIDVLCPSGKAMDDDGWHKKGNKGLFAKSLFSFDGERDGYRCPAGQWLSFLDRGKDGAGREYRRYRAQGCGQCELRAQCTESREGRSIKRYANEEYKEAMAVVLSDPRARRMYGRRMLIAEAVHAEFRERFGLRRFHRRGLGGVQAEFALYCIAFNIKKALRKSAFFVLLVAHRQQSGVWAPTRVIWAAAVVYSS